ncbi:MAG TPA: sugar nucleotide-binding protein [Terriglobales bacterium]|nr:sugar nucleotide-binding protein [Terriglobales bacterium]
MIIGAGGFVGQHLARRAASSFEVFEADLAPPPNGLAMDVTSAASVDAGFQQISPRAVVLLAALADIDQCEARPDLAEAVNVGGAAHVVEACAGMHSRLLFLSSAAVFDGARHGYCECDPVSPVSVYGRTKAKAEELITTLLPEAIVLRLALVIGFAKAAGTNAMLNKFAAKLRAGEAVPLPDFEYRNPIDAGTLSDFMLELLRRNETSGILHLGASESTSRFELGARLAQQMGFPRHLVHRQTQPVPGRAPRGMDHFLLTERIRTLCRTPVPTCDEVIERAIYGSSKGSL